MDSAVLVLFGAIFIVGVILLIVITLSRKPSGRLNTAKYQERWLNITSSMTNDPASMQMAVLNADTLLDTALKERGARGNNMGERLKQNPKLFRDINAIWTAHKLRNRIAHEHDMKLDVKQARQALESFKAGLKDLGAL